MKANHFSRKFIDKSDEELLNILKDTDNYSEDARYGSAFLLKDRGVDIKSIVDEQTLKFFDTKTSEIKAQSEGWTISNTWLYIISTALSPIISGPLVAWNFYTEKKMKGVLLSIALTLFYLLFIIIFTSQITLLGLAKLFYLVINYGFAYVLIELLWERMRKPDSAIIDQ